MKNNFSKKGIRQSFKKPLVLDTPQNRGNYSGLSNQRNDFPLQQQPNNNYQRKNERQERRLREHRNDADYSSEYNGNRRRNRRSKSPTTTKKLDSKPVSLLSLKFDKESISFEKSINSSVMLSDHSPSNMNFGSGSFHQQHLPRNGPFNFNANFLLPQQNSALHFTPSNLKDLDFRKWKFPDSLKQKHTFLNFFDVYAQNYLAKCVIKIRNAPRSLSLEVLQAYLDVVITKASHNVCRLPNNDLLINLESEEMALKVNYFFLNAKNF